MAFRIAAVCLVLFVVGHTTLAADPTTLLQAELAKLKVQPGDWPQWGGWSSKNNTPPGKNIPLSWDIKTKQNILWEVELGSQSYGNPVVANGKVYVGTNNHRGYVAKYPPDIDLGVLLCFDTDGHFLWQHSNRKLPSGAVHKRAQG